MLAMVPSSPVTVSTTAVLIAPANAKRKRIWITQTSVNAVRIGTSAVTAATGIRLGQNERFLVEFPDCPTDAIYAIREGASDGTVCVVEQDYT